MRISGVAVYSSVAAIIGWLYYVLHKYPYPNQRVCEWFEFFTDGWAPDFAAEDGRMVLASLWKRIFDGGHIQSSGLLEIVTTELQRLSSTSAGDQQAPIQVLELAAGTGVAAGLWHQALRQQGLEIQTILTDLQPMPESWQKLQQEYGSPVSTSKNSLQQESSISFVKESVSATNASAVLSLYTNANNDNGEVQQARMIHLALHHFAPQNVKALFRDAVQANAMIVVGDLVPSLPNIFFQSQWGFHELLRLIPTILVENPMKILWAALTPMVIFMAYHDAAVSVMRSYSLEQLTAMLDDVLSSMGLDGTQYKVKTYQMFTFSESLGIPKGTIPFLDSPHVQFFVATPVTSSNDKKQLD